MNNILVFDLETVPDVACGAHLLGLNNLSPESISKAMMSQAKATTGQAFPKHHVQKIVAISAVLRQGNSLKVWSLGQSSSSEAELIERFFAGIEKYIPTLVSWNGSQFDLPVLHYRALYHGIVSPLYWENGEQQPTFKYNNYQNRYHQRHLDLMDLLAAYTPKAYARLEEIALMLGLPGKMGFSGNDVLAHYLQGDIESIRNYCETDVLNTYLIYLRFQYIRGQLSHDTYKEECKLTKNMLLESGQSHLLEFFEAWAENDAKMPAEM